MKYSALLLALAASILGANGLSSTTTSSMRTTTTSSAPPSGTTWCNLVIPGPPVTAQGGVSFSGFQLARNESLGNMAVLREQGFNTQISYNDHGLGFFDNCHTWWLNIGENFFSYKGLRFDLDVQKTHNWLAGPATMIATTPFASSFLACNLGAAPKEWVLFLQTGTDMPGSTECYGIVLLVGKEFSSITSTDWGTPYIPTSTSS